jgi:hypothetical protein
MAEKGGLVSVPAAGRPRIGRAPLTASAEYRDVRLHQSPSEDAA